LTEVHETSTLKKMLDFKWKWLMDIFFSKYDICRQ
jgi:hypothetical protein